MSSLHLESLENRQLFAVGFDPVTGVLTATGGNGSDQIVVSDAGVNVNVSLNGAVSAFPKAQVKLIKLNGLGGNDSLRSVDSIKIRHEILGGSGNDFCRGSGGRDLIMGGNGNDVIDGGWEADVMQGNAGIDTVDYSHRTEKIVAYLRAGPHSEGGSLEHDITVSSGGLIGDVFTGNDIENYRGSSGQDVVFGNDLANKMWGNGGNDILRGGNGNDWLIGGNGADELHGEAGNDVLDGRDITLSDKLYGGAGVDFGWIDELLWFKDATNSVEILL